MASADKREGDVNRFGGAWTTSKLEVLGKYLHAYTTALKHQPFKLWYIDAFAGTGSRQHSRSADNDDVSDPLFPSEAEQVEAETLLDGSARIALKTSPPFDRFVFIEKNESRCAELESLRLNSGIAPDRIEVYKGDANEALSNIHEAAWVDKRAVMFLDPYGTQVEWRTIQAVAATHAIDLWILFPLMGVSRMLTNSGEIHEAWQRRLTKLFGTDAWYQEFYRQKTARTLFEEAEVSVEKAPAEAIGRYFNDRLREEFPGVVREPGVLRNSRNHPLFLLCFAASNKRGAPLALKIAQDLLKDLR